MGADEKTRVIIVDDVAETRENIRKLLQFEGDVEVVGVARSGREGCDLAKEIRPDVVLMDINMPDMDGIKATEIIRKSVPHAQIIILSVQSDASYMRQAMLAGARDFLTKPPAIDELTAAIRRGGDMAREEKKKARVSAPTQMPSQGMSSSPVAAATYGKIIVVYSPKGGVGCTTVATNLGIALNNEETPALIVDGNLQFGDVAVFLNEQGKNSLVDIAPRVDDLDFDTVDSLLIHHAASGIKVLAAPFKPEYAEGITGDQFVKVLHYLRRMFPYVIVDTSHSLDDITLGAIQDAGDITVLITTQDIPSIKNCRLFLDLADALGVSRKQILFVMNKYDKRIGITPEKVGESFKQEVVAVLPFDERVVLPSINRGVPFMLGNKSQPISRGILSLTEVIRSRLAELETQGDAKEPVKAIKGKR